MNSSICRSGWIQRATSRDGVGWGPYVSGLLMCLLALGAGLLREVSAECWKQEECGAVFSGFLARNLRVEVLIAINLLPRELTQTVQRKL